jgi:hypothetical protein
MADPKVSIPTIDPKNYTSEAIGRLEIIVQNAFQDGFRLGYAQAEDEAINRIIKAVRPNGHTAESGPTGNSPGAATRRLIDSVLRTRTSATPADIFESPQNTNGDISRQAIGKALRRGAKNRIYIGDDQGRYTKAGGTK